MNSNSKSDITCPLCIVGTSSLKHNAETGYYMYCANCGSEYVGADELNLNAKNTVWKQARAGAKVSLEFFNDMMEQKTMDSNALYMDGVMNNETMEKFQEPQQTIKEAWWNGARAALGLVKETPRQQVLKHFIRSVELKATTLADLLCVLNESVELSSANELKDAIKLIIEVQAMNYGMRDCIRAAFLNGPLDDGDVPSKSGRDELLTSGYMSKIVVNGEEGYNALTYKGARAYRLIKAGA